jgi:hypothetical protein
MTIFSFHLSEVIWRGYGISGISKSGKYPKNHLYYSQNVSENFSTIKKNSMKVGIMLNYETDCLLDMLIQE